MSLQEYLDQNYTKEEQFNLTQLDCSSIKLTSLNRIENLTNLTHLICFNNNITDLKYIYKLNILECLDTDIKYKSIEKERTKQKLLRRFKILKNYVK